MGDRRGSILVTALLIVFALFFMVLAAVNLFRAEAAVAAQAERDLVAAAAALAGIEEGFAAVTEAPDWNVGFPNVRLARSGGEYNVTFSRASAAVPFSTNNARGSAIVTGWNGRSVPAGAIHLVSVGTCLGARRIEEAMLSAPSLPYGYGIFGHQDGGVLGSSNLVDSYDSSLGPYAQTVQDKGGNIGTNSISAGKITVGTGTVVKGDVRVGPGGTSAVVKGSGTYQTLLVPTAPFPVAPVAAPFKVSKRNVSFSGTMTLAPGAYQDIKPSSGATLILQAGDYVLHRLETGSNVTVIVGSGPVNVYFTDHLRFGTDNRINTAGPPNQLNFYGAEGTKSHEFRIQDRGIGQFTLNAPNANFTLEKDSEFFGSGLVRYFSTQERVKIHYDLRLASQVSKFGILSQW